MLEGAQRVDGVEFGITGRPLPNWELIGAYTYLDAENRSAGANLLLRADYGNYSFSPFGYFAFSELHSCGKRSADGRR